MVYIFTCYNSRHGKLLNKSQFATLHYYCGKLRAGRYGFTLSVITTLDVANYAASYSLKLRITIVEGKPRGQVVLVVLIESYLSGFAILYRHVDLDYLVSVTKWNCIGFGKWITNGTLNDDYKMWSVWDCEHSHDDFFFFFSFFI